MCLLLWGSNQASANGITCQDALVNVPPEPHMAQQALSASCQLCPSVLRWACTIRARRKIHKERDLCPDTDPRYQSLPADSEWTGIFDAISACNAAMRLWRELRPCRRSGIWEKRTSQGSPQMSLALYLITQMHPDHQKTQEALHQQLCTAAAVEIVVAVVVQSWLISLSLVMLQVHAF